VARRPKNTQLTKEWLESRIFKGLAKSGYKPKEDSIKLGVVGVKNTQGNNQEWPQSQRILEMYVTALVCLVKLNMLIKIGCNLL